MKKREFMKFTNKGELPGTFFTSDWILNRDGFFPLEIQESWLKGEFHKKVLITIQPNTIPDEEFDLLNSNGTVVNFQKGSIVAKTTKEMKAIEDEGGANSDNIYYVMMATPTCVLISVAGMYLFVFVMRKNRDFSKIKENYLKKRKKNKKEYSKLPQYKSDVELKRLD
ncbi:hypothetical protein PACTADRAFT_33377 [Pachysolen tannophilus NRRL Y-2460]|uniref:Uncharacterized protein n=1 Tax=Pachysolen tannophilus NRRL Y-2460 TaxID=669874 RepID=A0A1E4TWU3_PACTA|nr:hypothetical protein PACTADRAFT_33377 [Pachysolen tannophilus NRRL Y-2460]